MSQKYPSSFTVPPGWQLLLNDLDIDTEAVLRRADLPTDLFKRPGSTFSALGYFRFWEAMDAEANDPLLAIRVGNAISAETFDAPLFAALCSPNLRIACARIQRFKPLMAPLRLHLETVGDTFSVSCEWIMQAILPPQALGGDGAGLFRAAGAPRHPDGD